MKLQLFDGGENSRVRPQYISINQGQVYENIDYQVGTLAPINMPRNTGQSMSRWDTYFIAGDRWVRSNERRDYVEYEETLYWTNRQTAPQKLSKTGVQQNLGIAPPSQITNASLTKYPAAINDVSIEPITAATGLPMETQYYLLINQDANGYSAAFHFFVDTSDRVTTIAKETTDPEIRSKINTSDSSDTNRRQVKVSDVKGITAGSVGYKLFRQYNNEFYLVGLFTSTLTDSVENISANEKLDRSLFGALKGVFTYVMTYYNSSDGAESAASPVSPEFDLSEGGYITLNNLSVSQDNQVTNRRIYRVGGNLAQFALVTTIDNTVTSFVDNIKDTEVVGTLLSTENAYPAPVGLAFLRQAYAMLFGAVGTKLRFTPVGKPNSWPETYFLQFAEPITGLVPVANGILVFSTYRTYIVVGTGPDSLAQYTLSGDQGCISYYSVQQVGTEAVWASTDGICASSGNRPTVISKERLGKITLNPLDSVVYDEAYYLMETDGSILCYDKSTIVRYKFNVLSLELANDKVYGWRDGFMHELFTGEEKAYFKFRSARFTEGQVTDNKTYKNIFLYCKGHVIINILINDVVVQTKELTGEESFQLSVPQELQRGFFIQFELEGTGEVYELNYITG